MMPYHFTHPCQTNHESITVKVEHPEYGPMETSTTASQLTSVRLYGEAYPEHSFIPFKNEVYDKIIEEESVIDFIENSIDKFLVSYQKDKLSGSDKLRKGAERQRIYRQNETIPQRERRLAMARAYIRKKRNSETDEERFERLKKQRERIRMLRQQRKMNPELDKIRRQAEAERMKLRRANESSLQRMKRLEKSRMYSRRRRENEVYRKIENEKNRIAHQFKRSDLTFRLQERQRDRLRKKIKRQTPIEPPQNPLPFHLPL